MSDETKLQPRTEVPIAKREHDPLDPFQQATKDDLVLPFRALVQGVSRTAGQRQGVPGYAVETVIGSEPKQFPKGAAHVLTFKGGAVLPEDTILEMRELAAQFQGVELGVPEVEIEDIPFE